MKLAKIKRIDFTFSNLTHSALISISGDSEQMYIHVQLINSFIKKVFGIEHIRFYNFKGDLKFDQAKHPFVYQLGELIYSQINEELPSNDSKSLHAV